MPKEKGGFQKGRRPQEPPRRPASPTPSPFQVDGGKFQTWHDSPTSNFVVPGLPPHIKKALGTNADSLIFSAETLDKQKRHHSDITASDYVSVLNAVPRCKEIYRTCDLHIGLVVIERKPWAVILKTTADRKETYMVSMHRLNDHTLPRFRQKYKRI